MFSLQDFLHIDRDALSRTVAMGPLQYTAHGIKITLLDGKRRSGTLKRKDISFLDVVISCFSCPSASFAIQQGVFVPCDRTLQRAHLRLYGSLSCLTSVTYVEKSNRHFGNEKGLEPKWVPQYALGAGKLSSIFSPVSSNSPRSLCESSLDPVSLSFLKWRL